MWIEECVSGLVIISFVRIVLNCKIFNVTIVSTFGAPIS